MSIFVYPQKCVLVKADSDMSASVKNVVKFQVHKKRYGMTERELMHRINSVCNEVKNRDANGHNCFGCSFFSDYEYCMKNEMPFALKALGLIEEENA